MSIIFTCVLSCDLSQVGDRHDALRQFQSYLNSKGEVLAQAPDLTVYCALPYIPDPASHSSFQHLFTVCNL